MQLTVNPTEVELRLIAIHLERRRSAAPATEEQVKEFYRRYGLGTGERVLDKLKELHGELFVVPEDDDDDDDDEKGDEDDAELRDAG